METLIGDVRLEYRLSDVTVKLIQSHTVISYILDEVLLAQLSYIPINRGDILDLCTENVAIPLLLSKRTKGTITELEIQPRLAHMASRSVALNNMEDRIHIVEGDLKERHAAIKQSFYDVVTCNPPYFATPKDTEHNVNEHLTIARHEVLYTLRSEEQ